MYDVLLWCSDCPWCTGPSIDTLPTGVLHSYSNTPTICKILLFKAIYRELYSNMVVKHIKYSLG